MWSLPTDLAHGCLCDLCVCRHPVGVSCCHCQSADHLQRLSRLGWDATLLKKSDSSLSVTVCHPLSLLITLLHPVSLFNFFLLSPVAVNSHSLSLSVILHSSLLFTQSLFTFLCSATLCLCHLSSLHHFSSMSSVTLYSLPLFLTLCHSSLFVNITSLCPSSSSVSFLSTTLFHSLTPRYSFLFVSLHHSSSFLSSSSGSYAFFPLSCFAWPLLYQPQGSSVALSLFVCFGVCAYIYILCVYMCVYIYIYKLLLLQTKCSPVSAASSSSMSWTWQAAASPLFCAG